MKFIRKNGRIIPIREKKDGQGDKRHISDKRMAQEMSNGKINIKKVAINSAIGFGFGALLAGLTLRRSTSGVNRIVKKSIGFNKDLAVKVGSMTALLSGGASMINVKTKQEIANEKLARFKKKKGKK